MKIVIRNLYGLKNGGEAYYRKQGQYCFDFVNNVKYASELTENEAREILNHAEFYMRQYGASEIGILE